jgi:hypothetical protein
MLFIIFSAFLVLNNDFFYLFLVFKKLALLGLATLMATILRKTLFWYIDFSWELQKANPLPVAIFLGLWYLACLISFALLF